MSNYCQVAVVIPTYNRGKMLVRAVRSVLNQSYLPLELIVVDDGSTDDTKKLLEALPLPQGLGFTYLQQGNLGPAAARNRGIAVATQPYLAFLDSDDHWHPRKLERQYGCLQGEKGFRISHTREIWLRNGLHLNQKQIHQPRHGEIFSHCLRLCAVGMSTVMVHGEVFQRYGGFDENMRCCEDYDMWLRLSPELPFLLVPEPLTIKEGGRKDQVSAIFRQGMDRWRIGSIDKLLSSTRLRREQYNLAVKELRRKAVIYGQGCLKHGKPEEGKQILELLDKYRYLP